MKSTSFADLVTCLTGDQPPRVWSLLVTVFGELAQDEGAEISGALLRHLSDLIGYKPEAVRVALHRLRKDGWIESRRHGRTSDYVLTAWGRAQSAKASPRIYATGPLAENAWLVVQEPGKGQPSDRCDGAWLTPNILLTPHPVSQESLFVAPVTEAAQVPDWMRARMCDEDIVGLAQKLLAALSTLEAEGPSLDSLAPCERAALRVLIVHDWRRIVLRTPVLPDHVFPPDWPVARCRARVVRLLQQLPRQPLDRLEHALPA